MFPEGDTRRFNILFCVRMSSDFEFIPWRWMADSRKAGSVLLSSISISDWINSDILVFSPGISILLIAFKYLLSSELSLVAGSSALWLIISLKDGTRAAVLGMRLFSIDSIMP